uniref:NADH-ubiquinone oxidoreductase chain 6 n=1 Tax=Laurentaeglyphea neocaledonica TaxID=910037 RepID=A0A342K7S6_9EUCA|nr:NADH dehydrogenase subunit 6 [Laurentaeglyphea neocaledonica]AMW67758.1 NADH dehydrogenase subunit 6 [Laurentaeglyphea neocaledonica]
MLLFFIPTITTMSFLFTRLSHPLSMGLVLLTQTVLICMTTGLINMSFWFSYILFLIFLGGMLVLFIYVASLASNESFSFSFMIFISSLLFIFFLSTFFIFMDPLFNFLHLPLSTSKLTQNSYLNILLISAIYNPPTMNFTLFMVMYLLLTLIVVVNLTNTFFGPLRLSA